MQLSLLHPTLHQFPLRRLWLQDEATHDGFPMLSRILLSENVGVCCIQETNAGDFTTLPVDQPHTYDGPCGSRGREAAFLIREGVVSTPIPGVQDSVSMRWRTVGESVSALSMPPSWHRCECSCCVLARIDGNCQKNVPPLICPVSHISWTIWLSPSLTFSPHHVVFV